MSTILAIESSCDDTGAAVISDGKLLANIVATQEIHEEYGGVVPELASRAHQQNIIPVVHQALEKANIEKTSLNAVAFTRGPGLLGSLLVGTSFAKSFAGALDLPLIDVNHMQAHILAHFIDDPQPKFPFLCLTVSGGHTQIVVVKDHLDMEVIGETKDDAVGEAFDKTAKIMGLPYPGGPLIDKYAAEGNPLAYKFPIVTSEAYNFSFSGIKTAFLYFLRDELKGNSNFINDHIHDICASMQYTLIEILVKKLKKAAFDLGINQIAIAGGVAANKGLRSKLEDLSKLHNWEIYIPKFEYCTDNAGMIAMAAHYKYEKREFVTNEVSPDPRMKL